MRAFSVLSACALLLCLTIAPARPAAAQEYQNATEAWNVAVAFLNSRNYASARAPLEAALKMADDDAFRVKVHEPLMVVYRELGESEKFIESAEYVLANSDSAPRQSLVRRSLLAHIQQQGKTDAFIKRHEEKLKQDPKNVTSLALLGDAYANLKRDPKRSAEMIERLGKLQMNEGEPIDVNQSANLARQYTQARKFREGAELYEKIAPLDERTSAWHWKEAAKAWLSAGDKSKALAAARKSAEAGPEKRSELLTHFWHRALGEVFLETGEPDLAITHLEGAIAATDIEGYIKDCQKALEQARKAAGK